MAPSTHKRHMFMLSVSDERDAQTVRSQIAYALSGTSLALPGDLKVSHMTTVDVVDEDWYSDEPFSPEKSLIGRIRGKFFRPKP